MIHLTPTPVLYHVSSICQHPPVVQVWRWYWRFHSYVKLHITYDLFYIWYHQRTFYELYGLLWWVFLRITDIIENQTNPVVSSSHYWILDEIVRSTLVFNRTRKRILRELLGTNGGYLNRRNWWFKSHKLSNSSCWNEN